jgi:hypothetical protein
LGYPPIGQIMKALEEEGSVGAARWIGCALQNFPRVETAQLAFSVITSVAMRSLVRADLAAKDSELAEYISAGELATPSPKTPPAWLEFEYPTEANHERGLSDGIVRMPRRRTEAERRGDRLFLHLQTLSSIVCLLFSILGGALQGWTGAGIGLVAGFLARFWMRRSMGLRGSNPHDGFFIRMRERADGKNRGLLEILIEHVRGLPLTREQCAEITKAWNETCARLERTTGAEERRALLEELDARIKRISYGCDE